MLHPPAPERRIPSSTNSLMSRNAVSVDDFAIAAQLLVVGLLSKPSSKRLSILNCRSLSAAPETRRQKNAFSSTASNAWSARSNASTSRARLHSWPPCESAPPAHCPGRRSCHRQTAGRRPAERLRSGHQSRKTRSRASRCPWSAGAAGRTTDRRAARPSTRTDRPMAIRSSGTAAARANTASGSG